MSDTQPHDSALPPPHATTTGVSVYAESIAPPPTEIAHPPVSPPVPPSSANQLTQPPPSFMDRLFSSSGVMFGLIAVCIALVVVVYLYMKHMDANRSAELARIQLELTSLTAKQASLQPRTPSHQPPPTRDILAKNYDLSDPIPLPWDRHDDDASDSSAPSEAEPEPAVAPAVTPTPVPTTTSSIHAIDD